MNRNIPVVALAVLIILAIMAMFGVMASEDAPPPPETATVVEVPPEEAAATPAIARLVARVDEARKKIVATGRETYGPNCLKLYPYAFRRANELTGPPQSLIAGIAGYESTGCARPRGGPGNILHVTRPSDVHVREAARLLGIPAASLNWQRHSEHSAVLGAVILEKGGSLIEALTAYHGRSEEHANAILAHGVLAQRYLRRKNSDYWDGPGSEVTAEELRSLTAGLPLLLPENEHALVSRE